MAQPSFSWQAPPSAVRGNLDRYGSGRLAALHALGDAWAPRLEGEMKANAPWTDRTGAARQGLRCFAERGPDFVNLWLVTSVSYGVHLELRNAGRYAIIMPTIERNQGQVMADARSLVGA